MAKRILFICVFLTAAELVFGQATAAINGRVVDQGGAVVPNAKVTVTSTGTATVRETVTNAEGLYSIPALNPGTYDMQAALTGFANDVKKNVELLTGATLTMDFSLGVAQAQQSVTVQGQAALIETTQSTTASSIRPGEVSQLPMLNRSLAALVTLLPGAREIPTLPGIPHTVGDNQVSIGGGAGKNFNTLVDGIDDKDDQDGGTAVSYSLEGVQEFRAQTSNFTAEYGKGAATLIIATKSGTNEVHGSAFGYFRNQSLTAIDYFSEPQNGGIGKPPYTRVQAGGSIGGPIIKNRAWYFGSFEHLKQNYTLTRPDNLFQQLQYLVPLNIGVAATHGISQPILSDLAQVKVNFQLSPSHTVFVRGSSETGYVQNGFVTTARALLACCSFSDKNQEYIFNTSAGWTWVVNPTTVNQLVAQFVYYEHDNSYPPCPPATCLLQRLNFPDVSTGQIQTYGDWFNWERKAEIKDDLSKQLGRHALKFGVDYTRLPKFGIRNPLSSPGAITFFDDPSTIVNNTNGKYPLGFLTPGVVRSIVVTSQTPPNATEQGAFTFGAYIQDDFKVTSRLTLNLGLRWDINELLDQPELAQSRTYQALKAIGSPYGQLPPTDKTDFGPRVGLAWDIGGDGKNVLRAGYGLFYNQGTMENFILPLFQMKNIVFISETFADPAIGQGQLASFVYGVTPLPAAPLAPTQFPTGQNIAGSFYSSSLQNPLAQQAKVGFSHLFPHQTVLAVDYTYILGTRGWRSLDINPLLNGVRPLASATLATYGDSHYFGPVNIIESVDRSHYSEVIVHAERRFSQTASLQANYTLAWASGMGGTADPLTGAIAPQIASATGGNISAPWEWGPVPYDERHRVTVAGVFNLPFGIDVSPSFTAASARPYTQYRAPNPSGDGSLMILCSSGKMNDVGFGAGSVPCGPGNARGQALVNANARVTKNFKFSEYRSLSIFGELYNIFNRANFGSNFNGNAFSPATYNKPTGYLGGIGATSTIPNSFQVQFGARVSF
jgi:hypothetical protein